MALLIGLNNEEVFYHLNRNLNYVSKRIGFFLSPHSEKQDKCSIIFTAYGYPKLYAKVSALQDLAPELQHFIPEAFIKPTAYLNRIKEKKDLPQIYQNYSFRVSDLQMTVLDYNITTKQLKIKIFIADYDTLKQLDDLDYHLEFIIMAILGEIAFKKHIKKIEFAQLPQPAIGLINLAELPELIEYLYKINSRDKTRFV